MKVKDTTTSLQEREPGKDIAWNHPRCPAEAEARMKSASRSRTAQLVCPEGFHETPSKFWRTREITQEGWQSGQGPRTTRNYADNVITQENGRTHHIRTRKPKGQRCNPSRQRQTILGPSQGRIPCNVKGTLPEATPVPLCQKQKSRSHPRERGDVENLRHPVYTLAPLPGKSDFRKSR